MFRKITLPIFILCGQIAKAGTGHAKDLDLAYIIVLILFALIIGIWNGIDFIRKNRGEIKNQFLSLKEKLIDYLFAQRKDIVGDHHQF